MPQVEMGQGVYTSIAMILAEELDADFSRVSLLHAPPNETLYANPAFGVQATGKLEFDPRVLEAAAYSRGIDTRHACPGGRCALGSRCRRVLDLEQPGAARGSGRSLGYGELVDAAGALAPVADAPQKDPSRFTLIGRRSSGSTRRKRSTVRRCSAST
jgi:isoquinoline 1-oxidoreductase beta subunit